MKIENPAAYSFLMQEDIYLLQQDKATYSEITTAIPVVAPSVVTEAARITAVTEPTSALTEPLAVTFKYLGGFKKKLLILVHYVNQEFIDEQHLSAIENILKRLGLTLDDAAIFNRAKYVNTTFEQISSFFRPEKWLILGVDALPPGIENLELNKPMLLNKGNCLYSFSFADMMENVEYKKIFWEQMKQL